MKKIFSVLAALVITAAPAAVMAEGISVVLDGTAIEFDVAPQIINDRTMVPVRAIFEALGAEVDWNGDTQTVTSAKDGTYISLTINSNVMYVNGSAVTLDRGACIINDRTLVPVRAVSEAFGVAVGWDGDTQTVYLTSVQGAEKFRELADALKEKGAYDAEYNEYVISAEDGAVFCSASYLASDDNIFFYYSREEDDGSYSTVSLLIKNDGTGAVGRNVSHADEYVRLFGNGGYFDEANDDIIEIMREVCDGFDALLEENNFGVSLADLIM